MGRYRVLEAFFDRIFRNDLNANFEDISNDIDALDGRISEDVGAVDERVTNAISGTGGGNEEVRDARQDAAGVVQPTLRNRLASDLEITKDGNRLNNDSIPSIKLKTTSDAEKIKLVHLSQEVTQAIAGTAPVNAIPGDGTITLAKLSIDIQPNVAEALTNAKATKVNDLVSSDITVYYGSVALDPSTKTLSATRDDAQASYAMPILFPKAKDLVFQKVTGHWMILAINNDRSKWIGISLGGDIGKIVEFTKTGNTQIQAANTLWTGLVAPTTNDIVRVTVIDSQTYKFMVKKAGETVFTDLFTLKKSQVPAITIWNDNSTLGYTKFTEVTGAQDLIKNVTWAESGLARDVSENNTRSVSNENTLKTLNSSVATNSTDISVLKDAVNSQGVVNSLVASDVIAYFGTVTVNATTKVLTATRDNTQSTFAMPLFFKGNQVVFEKMGANWIILGGDSNKWVAMSIGSSDAGRIVEFTKTGYTVKQEYDTLWQRSSLPVPVAGDMVRLTILPGNNSFKIEVQRAGTTTWLLFCTLEKTQAPAVTAWNGKSVFGYTKFTEETTGTQDIAKNVTWTFINSVIQGEIDELKADVTTNIADISLLKTSVNDIGVYNNLIASDVTAYYGSVTVDQTTKVLTAIRDDAQSTYAMPIFFKGNQVTFEDIGPNWIILGGDSAKWVAMSIGAGDAGRIVEFTKTGFVVKQEYDTLWMRSSLPVPVAGDMVRMIIVDSDSYKIQVKRAGTTNWLTYVTLDKSQVPSVTAWNGKSVLGYTKFTEQVGTTQDMAKNVIWSNSAVIIESDTTILQQDVAQLKVDVALNNRWKGLKWNSMGDSITAANGYQQTVKTLLGLSSYNNYGISGTCLASSNTGDNQSMAYRVGTMDNTADLVTVFGGTNDWGNGTGKPLGQMGDTENTTIYGAIDYIIKSVLTNNPKAKLAFFTPLQRNFTGTGTLGGWSETTTNSQGIKLIQIVDAIIEVCGKYGIPVLDLYRLSGITDLNKTQWLSDGLHPNSAGHALIGKQIAAFLARL